MPERPAASVFARAVDEPVDEPVDEGSTAGSPDPLDRFGDRSRRHRAP